MLILISSFIINLDNINKKMTVKYYDIYIYNKIVLL
jgi:hypothetical protein